MKSRIPLTGAIAAAVALLATANPAVAADRPLEGNGWRLQSKHRITSIAPGTAFTITFTSTALKTKYTPYLTRSIAQLKAEGVNISIGGVTNIDPGMCPPTKGTIQFAEVYRAWRSARNAAWGMDFVCTPP
ncbi:hypothetical protein ACIOJD_13240 [Streptomyces sp. NPDC088116]|uniref:hypothetical protein n=1 Tax=Streptomyces sp. NPDC088116 TaxID=3365825 RepID=UPI0037F71D75